MVNYSSKLLKGASIIFIASLFSSLLGYFIRIVLARKLTTEEFGLFFAVYNVILLVGWLKGFGLHSTIGKYIPQYAIEKKHTEIKSILVFVAAFTLLSNFLFLSIIFFFPQELIARYFQSDAARSVLLVLFGYVFLDGLSGIITGYFLSVYRFVLYSLREVMIRAAVLFLLIFASDLSVLETAFIYAAASLLNFVVNIISFFKNFPFFKYPLNISKKNSKELFQFSIPLMIRDFFGILMAKVDNIILIYFRPLWEVGIYNVILPTADMLLIFSRPFGRIMFPLSSELFALKEQAKINFLLGKIHKHLLLVLLPCSVTIFLFASFLLRVVFGTEYESGSLGLTLLAFGFIFNSMSIVSYSVLLGIGKQKIGAAVTIIANVINAILTLILVPYFGKFNLGYVGAIIGTVISSGILFFLISYYLKKAIGYLFPSKSTAVLLFIGLVMFGIGYFLQTAVVNVYVQILLFSLVIVLVYPLLLFLFGLTSVWEIRSTIATLLKKDKSEEL